MELRDEDKSRYNVFPTNKTFLLIFASISIESVITTIFHAFVLTILLLAVKNKGFVKNY